MKYVFSPKYVDAYTHTRTRAHTHTLQLLQLHGIIIVNIICICYILYEYVCANCMLRSDKITYVDYIYTYNQEQMLLP